MSTHKMPTAKRRLSVRDIRQRKGGKPLVVLTAYSAPFARILDPHVDVLLVGDSLGMVLYGMESTLNVSLDTMIAHGGTVMRASSHACVVVDMPFASYQASKEQAFESCARILAETGCNAVKCEGGEEIADTIYHLTRNGIPVMGHVGLMPQHVQSMGGFRYQGRTEEQKEKIIHDAKSIADAGAFSMVVEGTMPAVAEAVTHVVNIPTIGIGASAVCDGQVLVTEDMLGMLESSPGFAKQYVDMSAIIDNAAATFAQEGRDRHFPSEEYYAPPAAITKKQPILSSG